MHVVAAGKDLFLTVERKVVAVFADQHLGEQTGRRQPAFAQALGQRRDDGGEIGVGAVNEFAANDPAAQETAGFVVELFVHFLADAAPGLRLCFHRLGIDDLFDQRQMLRQTRPALRAGTRSAFFPQTDQRWGREWDAERAGGELQEQFELRGIEGFAAGSEDAAHERIDLLAQERVLLLRRGQRGFQRDDAFAQKSQFVPIGAHRARDPIDAGGRLFKAARKYFQNVSRARALVPRAQLWSAQVHSVRQKRQRLWGQAQLGRVRFPTARPGVCLAPAAWCRPTTPCHPSTKSSAANAAG